MVRQFMVVMMVEVGEADFKFSASTESLGFRFKQVEPLPCCNAGVNQCNNPSPPFEPSNGEYVSSRDRGEP